MDSNRTTLLTYTTATTITSAPWDLKIHPCWQRMLIGITVWTHAWNWALCVLSYPPFLFLFLNGLFLYVILSLVRQSQSLLQFELIHEMEALCVLCYPLFLNGLYFVHNIVLSYTVALTVWTHTWNGSPVCFALSIFIYSFKRLAQYLISSLVSLSFLQLGLMCVLSYPKCFKTS